MKKNLFNRFAVIMITVLLTLTAANTFAQSGKMNFTIPVDTPYLAIVQIDRIGMADTPYLSFSSQPQVLYSQLKYLMQNQDGSFHIIISYINKEGEKLEEEDYYIDNSSL